MTEAETKTTNQNFVTSIRQNWMILVFIGSLIMAWTNMVGRISAVEEFKVKQESQNGSNQALLISIQKDIVEVKTVLELIKNGNIEP